MALSLYNEEVKYLYLLVVLIALKALAGTPMQDSYECIQATRKMIPADQQELFQFKEGLITLRTAYESQDKQRLPYQELYLFSEKNAFKARVPGKKPFAKGEIHLQVDLPDQSGKKTRYCVRYVKNNGNDEIKSQKAIANNENCDAKHVVVEELKDHLDKGSYFVLADYAKDNLAVAMEKNTARGPQLKRPLNKDQLDNFPYEFCQQLAREAKTYSQPTAFRLEAYLDRLRNVVVDSVSGQTSEVTTGRP